MIDFTERRRAAAAADPRYAEEASSVRRGEPGIGGLLKELRDEMTLLVHQEVALARLELNQKFSRVARDTAYLIAGAQVAMVGLLFVLLAVTAGVYVAFYSADMWLHGLWAAPLIVGGVVSLIGVALVLKGKNNLQATSPLPERTVETMKENKEWVREKV